MRFLAAPPPPERMTAVLAQVHEVVRAADDDLDIDIDPALAARRPAPRALLRHTTKKRMRATLKAIREATYKRRHQPVPVQGQWLNSVVRGYLAYHALCGGGPSHRSEGPSLPRSTALAKEAGVIELEVGGAVVRLRGHVDPVAVAGAGRPGSVGCAVLSLAVPIRPLTTAARD